MQVQKSKQGYNLIVTNLRHREQIHDDWKIIPLKNLIMEIKTGFAEGERDDDGLIQLRMNNISDDGTLNFDKTLKVPIPDNIDEYVLKKNDVLFNNTNSLDLIGKSTIVQQNFDYTFSNHITRIRVNQEKLVPYFLLLILLKYKREALFRSICNTHVGQSGIGKNELLNVKIICPPLKEQQKIASILSNVDSLIQHTQNEIEQTQRLKKGLMQRLLTKGIGHTKFKKIKWLFEKEIEIPKEWERTKISEIFQLKTGGTPSRLNPEYFSGDIPWVTSTDLNRGIITQTLEKITKDAKEKSRLKIFPKGTFVIATYGLEAAGTRGKCGILAFDATINQACMAFLPSEKMTVQFLFYFYLEYGERMAFNYAQGTKQQNLYPDTVKEISLIVPPIKEQEKITHILHSVDSKVNDLKLKKSGLETLKKGLMQKLLTGQIRVKV
jgi:type I restriction enzyme, S subunit